MASGAAAAQAVEDTGLDALILLLRFHEIAVDPSLPMDRAAAARNSRRARVHFRTARRPQHHRDARRASAGSCSAPPVRRSSRAKPDQGKREGVRKSIREWLSQMWKRPPPRPDFASWLRRGRPSRQRRCRFRGLLPPPERGGERWRRARLKPCKRWARFCRAGASPRASSERQLSARCCSGMSPFRRKAHEQNPRRGALS